MYKSALTISLNRTQNDGVNAQELQRERGEK
jgi:hypothetical protein